MLRSSHLVLSVSVPARAAVVVNLAGTAASPFITATVDNGDVFSAGVFDNITFFLAPNTNDIAVTINGPLGPNNPDIIRAPFSGSYLNLLRLSSGNFSTFTLDQTHPYISSTTLTSGSVTGLSALNGVTTTMSLNNGTGPATTPVRFNYNIVPAPEPASLGLLALSCTGLLMRRRRC